MQVQSFAPANFGQSIPDLTLKTKTRPAVGDRHIASIKVGIHGIHMGQIRGRIKARNTLIIALLAIRSN